MNGKGVLNTLKSRFLCSVYRHDPHGRGIVGKIIGALLIIDFLLFVILIFTDVLIPYRNGDFPSYRLGL